jgi:hypothetical protein
MKIKIQQLKIQQLFISILAMLVVIACGTGSKNNEKADTSKMINVDTVKAVQPVVEEEKKLTPNDITVKLFDKGWDRDADEEGGPSKGEIYEVQNFGKEKYYQFCYDSEYFNRLEILGNGKGLSIVVKNNGETIFSKENFDLKDKIKFTDKDFTITIGYKITIIIKQNETVLFKGKIDTQGCM